MESVTLDELLPVPQVRERHERFVAAPPAAVWAALHELALRDLPLSATLMAIRLAPAALAGRRSAWRMVGGRFLGSGPLAVLASDEPRSVVCGGVLQPWKLAGGERPPRLDAAGLRSFAEPGWVKAGLDFALEPRGAGTLLTTETRIEATDPRTREAFARYWRLVRSGSGLIRREMLRSVARRAHG